MDFRQCPACQASVLDDDAAECPFCGASMSGKPAATPARPQTPEKPAAKPKPQAETPKRQAPARKVGETVADEDDPFGIDTSAIAQVPKVAPRPAKGRMIRIQCPMCETPGFISSKMQGRDVKCCNPDCMVPVFKAPRPEKKDDDEADKKGMISGRVLGVAAGVTLLLGGLLFWGFYLSRQQGSVAGDPNGAGTPYVPPSQGGNETEPVAPPTQPVEPKSVSLAEVKRQSLAKIITAAQSRDDNRKAYGRRLAAEAHAVSGDLAGAREQINQLQKRNVGGNVPYFQIEPLLLIAWRQLADGHSDDAKQLVEQAAAAYQKLPQVGRQVLTGGIALAAAQGAFEQIPQAKNTLRQLEAERERAKVAALLEIANRMETYDLDQLLQMTSLAMSVDPLAVAVAVDIASHGRWEQAVAWGRAQPDVASREDCLAALATFAGLQSTRGEDAAATLLSSIEGLSPSGQTRLRAGLATGFLMGGDQSRAREELARTLESFSTEVAPDPVGVPTVKQIHDSDGKPNAGLPDTSPLQSSAVAAMQVARLQSSLGEEEAAWATLIRAWEFTAAMAPSLAPMAAMVDEFENNRPRTEDKLNQQLNLRSNDQRRLARNQYRGQLRVFEDAARARFNMERGLLRDAVTMGFAEKVEAFRRDPAAVVASAASQPYQQANEDDRLMQAFATTEEMFSTGQYKQTAQMLADFRDIQNKSNEERRDLRALQLACRLLKLKQVDALMQYVDALNDPLLAEDALELTAALGVLDGLGPQVWERYPQYDLQPTEKVALYRGLIAGITTLENRKAPSAQTAATE